MAKKDIIDVSDLPRSVTSEEVHYMEIGLADVNPNNTTVNIKLGDGRAISGPMPLKFHSMRQNKAIFRGKIFVGSFDADGSRVNVDGKITVIVRTGNREEKIEESIQIHPPKGAWVKIQGKGQASQYVAITRYGHVYNRIKSASNVAAMSSETGLLWIAEANRLKAYPRLGQKTPFFSHPIVGVKVLAIAVGRSIVATLERTRSGSFEAIAYHTITGRAFRTFPGGYYPFFMDDSGDDMKLYFSTGSATLLTTKEVKGWHGRLRIRDAVIQSPPHRQVLVAPNGELSLWFISEPIRTIKGMKALTPGLICDYLVTDDFGFWLISGKRSVAPTLTRYEEASTSGYYCVQYSYKIRGPLNSGGLRGGTILASTRSNSMAFVATNADQEGNLLIVDPLGIKKVNLGAPIQQILTNRGGGYYRGKRSIGGTGPWYMPQVWHRTSIGQKGSKAKLHIIARPRKEVQIHLGKEKAKQKSTDRHGRATFTVEPQPKTLRYIVTADDPPTAITHRERSELGLIFVKHLHWGAIGGRTARIGLYGHGGQAVILKEMSVGPAQNKATGILTDQNTLWTQSIPSVTRLSYQQTDMQSFYYPNLQHAAPTGEFVWLLLRTATPRNFVFLRRGPDCESETYPINEAKFIASLSKDYAIIITRKGGPRGTVFAHRVGVGQISKGRKLPGINTVTAVTNGPGRIWVFGKNFNYQNVLIPVGEDARPIGNAELINFRIDTRLITGRNGKAWAFSPGGPGTKPAQVVVWREPGQVLLKGNTGGSPGVSVVAGKNTVGVISLTYGTGARARQFKIEGNTLKLVQENQLGKGDFLWKLLE